MEFSGINELFRNIMESINIINKSCQKIIDSHGDVKGIHSKNLHAAEAFHDYIFFCFTKSSKSLSAAFILVDKEKSEDAMILLHSVYRNYLTIAYLMKHPSNVCFFMTDNSDTCKGEIKMTIDEEGVINNTLFMDSEFNNNGYSFPKLSNLVKETLYPEDMIIHNHIDHLLSDYVYSNFMTSGNYRDKEDRHYIYDDNYGCFQSAHIGLYLQLLIIKEVCKFINNDKLNFKINDLFKKSVLLLIQLTDALDNILDIEGKAAMKDRLKYLLLNE